MGLNPESVPTTGLDNDAYGDIYGKIGAVMQQMVPEEYQDQLTPELLETLQSVDFHVDTSQGLRCPPKCIQKTKKFTQGPKFCDETCAEPSGISVWSTWQMKSFL